MKPCRTLLFMPAHRDRVLEKGLASAADALLPDLEDSVPVEQKDAARGVLHDWLPGKDRPIFVRINGPTTGLTRLDLEAVVGPTLGGVMIPKVDSVDQLREVVGWLDELERRCHVPAGQVEIIPMIESALGVERAFDLARGPRVVSLCFASAEDGDLQTDLGCEWSPGGYEMLHVRSRVLVAARAAGLACPLDGVFGDLESEAGLIKDTEVSKRLGYKGRTVIHPKQIEPCNRIYTPAPERVGYYRRLLEAFSEAEQRGQAAISFEGKLVDYAMAARARDVVAFAEAVALQAQRGKE